MSDAWVLASAGTSPEIVAPLNRALNESLQTLKLSEALAQFNRWAAFHSHSIHDASA
jgi:tripartite-type tricarboxylate transporter receptor subunit TctC